MSLTYIQFYARRVCLPSCITSSSSRTSCFTSKAGEDKQPVSPIRVAPKPKPRSTKRGRNVFFNDHGFPDKSDDYDNLLNNVDGGIILRKKKFPLHQLMQPTLNSIGSTPTTFMQKSSAMNSIYPTYLRNMPMP
jgi:hypothetical protein